MRRLLALTMTTFVLCVIGTPRVSLAEGRDGQGPDERGGCCSHHHGVCGCSGSVVQCCDGTGSSSCTC